MDSTIRWFAEEWAAGLTSALYAMTGEQAEGCAGPVVESAPAGLCWQQPLSVAPGASISILLPQEVWKEIGGRILQAAGLPSDEDAALKDAFLEVVRQGLSQLASKLGRRIGSEVELHDGKETADAPAGLQWQEVSLNFGGALPPCAIGISRELAVLVADAAAHFSAAVGAAASGQAVTAVDSGALAPPATRNSKTLDLLLEVDLPIGVSFGRTQMRLKEALKLTTGSIVELNRSVTEPVEIVVNNCVIARGEVVVVEGNYGVRILEIISREERLRTLF
jgi:flagellar motor switch protein FliN/FliY